MSHKSINMRTNFNHTVSETREVQKKVEVSMEKREREISKEASSRGGRGASAPKKIEEMTKEERKNMQTYLSKRLNEKNGKRVKEIDSRIEAIINNQKVNAGEM